MPPRIGSVRSDRDRELARLLTRVGTGDRAAFALLYEATHPGLYAEVLGVVRDPSQSEEVTQEAYLRIWQTSAAFNPSLGSARHWLRLLARRCSIDWVRKAESLRRLDLHDYGSSVYADYDSTTQALEDHAEVDQLRAAFGTLTDLEREALRLVYYQGQTHEQTARALDIPAGTAKSRIRSGVRRLRRALGSADVAAPPERRTTKVSDARS